MNRRLPTRAVIFGLLALFACLGTAFTAVYVQTRPNDFPFGEPVRFIENCGTTEVSLKNGGLLITQNRCIITEQTFGQIFMWYTYEPGGKTNQQEHVEIVETRDLWVRVISTKRVQVALAEEDESKRMIRIYHVISVLPPWH